MFINSSTVLVDAPRYTSRLSTYLLYILVAEKVIICYLVMARSVAKQAMVTVETPNARASIQIRTLLMWDKLTLNLETVCIGSEHCGRFIFPFT